MGSQKPLRQSLRRATLSLDRSVCSKAEASTCLWAWVGSSSATAGSQGFRNAPWREAARLTSAEVLGDKASWTPTQPSQGFGKQNKPGVVIWSWVLGLSEEGVNSKPVVRESVTSASMGWTGLAGRGSLRPWFASPR